MKGFMKKSIKVATMAILYCGSVFLLTACGGGGGDSASSIYDNSTLSGAWLLIAETQGEPDLYLNSDGNGNITDFGAFNLNSSNTYSVSTDGLLAVNLGSIVGTGRLTSATTGSLTFANVPDTVVYSLVRINDLTALVGSWSGTLKEDALPTNSYNVTIAVSSSGEIASLTGFASPISGKIYYESGKIAGFIHTAESNSYNQIHINGTLANGVTINGTYGIDNGSAFDGTLVLSKL